MNVVTRSQQLVPFARLGPYSVAELSSAIYAQRRGFEYWGHMASWLPIEDFRYFLPRMERMRRTSRGWWSRIRTEHAELYPLVLERVRNEGPIGAAAFEDPRERRGTWWDWKPAKLVLEDLLDRGELMCASRTSGFARLYDLPERVLPPAVDRSDPGAREAARYLLLRAAAVLGVATAAELADYYRLRPDEWRPALAELREENRLIEIEIEGWPRPTLALADRLVGSFELPEHRPTLLSPFDNLIWERRRLERLFDFHYRVEIYVPAPQRRFGYYVMPLLARGALGGRVDVKFDRQADVLRAQAVWLEGAQLDEARSALDDLARQLGAGSVEVDAVSGPSD
ncbi:MAG: YcaQ family DNA glycosylase [Chloroflexi bacterium]|nr:YcaQ family DNA glycosylase [Chloroflexota bacterium]